MGREGVVSEKLKPTENGNTQVKRKAEVEEAVTDKKGEQPDGVTEMEEDEISEEKALENEKGSKKSSRSKSSAGEKEPAEEEKGHKSPTVKKTKEEPKTPIAATIERPVRKRKSVKRLVASLEKDPPLKEFIIEQGPGTALKDIPNVAYKLSRRKTEDTFKLLHSVLFGRRGKAAQVKNNISRFSGFVWHDNEEKQMSKIKEKLDKYNKEKLAEFCDVLDVPISSPSNTRKEDIVAKLLEFLMAPHATTSDLLSEKEQGKKRKRSRKTASGSSAPSKGSVKSRKKAESTSKKDVETKSTPPESENESGDEEDGNGVPERSDDEMSEQAASEDKGSESEEESVEDETKQKQGSAKSSVKKGSSAKAKTKEVTKKSSPAKSKGSESGEEAVDDKEKQKGGSAKPSGKKGSSEKAKTNNVTISKKTNPPPKKVPAKSPSRSKSNDVSSAKKSSGKKKEEAAKKSSTSKSLKESPGKKDLKVKDEVKEETTKPTDDELNSSVCKILKEVDFNKATFTDIMTLLGKEYNMDLTLRKMRIKSMIQDELTRIASADEVDDVGAEKDDKNASNASVKA
ncbi:hypothetical protein ACS0TY_016610 [Phlomoides rotata]